MAEQFGMRSYAKGVFLLTLATLFVKILSMIYRIPFQNLVGDQGFYIYQQVYPFVAFFVTWAASGLAVAVARIILQEKDLKQAVTNELSRFLWILAIVLFFIMYNGAFYFAKWMGDEKLQPLLEAGAFVTLCMPALSIYKGIAQADHHMTPVAVSQVIEQIVRVAIILIGTWWTMRKSGSLYVAGEFATVGTVLGEVAGVFLLFFFMKKQRVNLFHFSPQINWTKRWHLLRRLVVISISMSLSSLLLILFQLVDSFTVYDALYASGMTSLEAMEMKGVYDRGQPLVQVGLVIATSMALAIVPLILYERKKGRIAAALRYAHLTYKTSLVFSIAATIGLMLVMPYLNKTMFETTTLSFVLCLFVFQIIWLTITMTFVAILQGFGYTKVPVYLLVFALMIKLLCNRLCIEAFGIAGAAITSNVALIVTSSCFIYFYKKKVATQLASSRFYSGLTFATFTMVCAVVLCITLMEQVTVISHGRFFALAVVCVAGIIGSITFVFIAMKRRVLTPKEWFVLPLGRKLAAMQIYINRTK